MKLSKILLLCSVLPVLALAGCYDLSEPTAFSDERIRIEKSEFSRVMRSAAFDENYAYDVWNHYRRYGNSAVKITVAYNPSDRDGASMDASVELARIIDLLAKEGVRDVQGDIMPVKDDAVAHTRVLLSYKTVTANAPDCEHQMPGLSGDATRPNYDYRLGCSMNSMIARQVSRPADLIGTDGVADADARRQSSITDRYRSGERNDELAGESLAE